VSIVIYLLLGAFTGLCSGLLGIGGGIIVVPALAYIFSHTVSELPPEVVMHLAIGTSLAVMVVTSTASASAHHRLGTVQWMVWRRWVPGLLLGVVLGVVAAKYTSTVYLKSIFGVFLFLTAARMLLSKPVDREKRQFGRGMWIVIGSFVGVCSGLLGVGGGVVMVPFLNRCGFSMKEAAGTAAASTLPIAIFGASGNIISGWQETHAIAHCLGFVYFPAFIAIVPAGFLMAPVGAKLSHILPAALLKKGFAVLLLCIAIDMVI
jgi:uncharacterized membrane protein YfcA